MKPDIQLVFNLQCLGQAHRRVYLHPSWWRKAEQQGKQTRGECSDSQQKGLGRLRLRTTDTPRGANASFIFSIVIKVLYFAFFWIVHLYSLVVCIRDSIWCGTRNAGLVGTAGHTVHTSDDLMTSPSPSGTISHMIRILLHTERMH